jgi:hypothetical protein
MQSVESVLGVLKQLGWVGARRAYQKAFNDKQLETISAKPD